MTNKFNIVADKIRMAKVIFDIDSGLYEVVTNNGYANKEDAEKLRVKIEELIKNE